MTLDGCRCRKVVELARAAIEGRDLPPRNCPVHSPDAEERAREEHHRADHLAELDDISRRIHADRAQPDPAPPLAAVAAAAFGAHQPDVRTLAPALNSDALLDSIRARLGIPTDDLPPAA